MFFLTDSIIPLAVHDLGSLYSKLFLFPLLLYHYVKYNSVIILNKLVYSTSSVLTDKMSHTASFLLRSYYSLSVA